MSRDLVDAGDTPWIKASASGTGGDCVEMRRRGRAVEVRDSKAPTRAALTFDAAQFAAWLAGAATGEYPTVADQ